jgi:hypothetical protein
MLLCVNYLLLLSEVASVCQLFPVVSEDTVLCSTAMLNCYSKSAMFNCYVKLQSCMCDKTLKSGVTAFDFQTSVNLITIQPLVYNFWNATRAVGLVSVLPAWCC